MLNWIDRLFNQYKFVRRLLVIWAAILITAVSFKVFGDGSGEMTAEFGLIVGILTTVIAFYQWSRNKDV